MLSKLASGLAAAGLVDPEPATKTVLLTLAATVAISAIVPKAVEKLWNAVFDD